MRRKPELSRLIVLLVQAFVPALRAQNTTVQYFYDDLGRLVKVLDQNGNVATYAYDAGSKETSPNVNS